MQGDAPQSSAGGKSHWAPWMLPDVPAGRGPAKGALALLILAEPVEPAAPEPSGAGGGRWRESPDPGGSSTAWHGMAWQGTEPPGPAPEQRPRAGPARVAHRATHGPPQPGGWDSIGEESTGSSSKSQALLELGSLTAGSFKNWILRELDPPPSVGSFKNWILRELDPLSTRSFSEC